MLPILKIKWFFKKQVDFSIATGLQTRCYGKITMFEYKSLGLEFKKKPVRFYKPVRFELI
jgi:hypothetical protein